jgi:transcriptional regulator with XRE-family HTH domain
VIVSELPTIKSLAGRLSWARKRKGWTQDELSIRAQVSRDVIAKVESGVTRMPRQIKQLASATEVPPAWLAFGSEKIDEWSEEILELAQALHELPVDSRETVKTLIGQLKKT